MRSTILIILLLLCSSVTSAYPLQREGRFDAAGLNEQEVEAFFVSFREAVSTRDKKKVASLISYPIKVTLSSGARRTIRNRADFIKAYDLIFNEKFSRLIVETRVTDLWARWTGVATPLGEIWFSGIGAKKSPDKYTIKIIAINGLVRS
jgi:hypothetical protein